MSVTILKVVVVLLSCFWCCSNASLQIRKGENDILLFREVTAAHKYFGIQNYVNATFSKIQRFTSNDLQLLCMSLDNATILSEILLPKFNGKPLGYSSSSHAT